MASNSSSNRMASPNSKEKTTRIPSRGSGIFRPLFNKISGHKSSSVPKSKITKESKANEQQYNAPSSLSPSTKGRNISDNSLDLKSSLGNSRTLKNNPENSGNVKGLAKPEPPLESRLPNVTPVSPSKRLSSTPKTSLSDTQISLKAPVYKREPNGKWSLDEKYFGPETTPISKPKPFYSSKESSPGQLSSKVSPSDNSFSTYASYKRQLSYQKKAIIPKPLNLNTKEKSCSRLPTSTHHPPSSISIPMVRKQPIEAASSYCCAEKDKLKGRSESFEESKFSPLQKQSSPVSKSSDSLSILSPPSDDNRDFLIDDEIADQPGLTFFNDLLYEDSEVELLQLALSELHSPKVTSIMKNPDDVHCYFNQKGLADLKKGTLKRGLAVLEEGCSVRTSNDLIVDCEKKTENIPGNTTNESKSLLQRASGGVSSSSGNKPSLQRTLSAPLRPPRQMTVSEADDGGLKVDSSSYRLLCQDLNGIKTLLLRLKSVLQEVETINPFDQSIPNNIFYHTLAQNDFPSNLLPASINGEKKSPDINTIFEENADLRRQIVLFHQQLEEKDHAINLLQQQMTKYLSIQPTCMPVTPSSNAATQTERKQSLSGSLSTSSFSDDSVETLISSQVYLKKTLKKQSSICLQYDSNSYNPRSIKN